MSHIPKFGDASKSPSGDTSSPAGDTASLSGDAVVSYWRCASTALTSTSPIGHAVSPAGDVVASPNCGICDTAGAVSYIPKFGDANKSPARDTASPNYRICDTAELLEDFRIDLPN